MKKPIIFLSVFLALYTINLLILSKTTGINLLPAPQNHSKDTMPLLTKSTTFNPIPLSLIKDSPSAPKSRYVRPKEGVIPAAIPAVVPPAAPVQAPKEEEKKPSKPTPPAKDFSKNTPDFAPNPPDSGTEAAVTTPTVATPEQVPPQEAQSQPQAAPEVKEKVEPAPKKQEEKPVKQATKKNANTASKYQEIVDNASDNQTGKDAAFVMIQESPSAKVTKVKEAQPKPLKEAAEKQKLSSKLPQTKEQQKQPVTPMPAAVAPAPVVQPAPAPKPDNSAKLEEAGLVDIESLPIKVFLDIRYATVNNFTGKKLYNSSKCYLNKNVAQAFVKAVFYAQADGLYFRIYDCYRPSSVQQIMWDKEDNGKFLSSPGKGSNHSRGGAIDLGLCDASGKALPAPTGFDNFTDSAAYNATEGISEEAIKNRTKLQDIMKKAGFTTIKNEWWHFDYKDAKNYTLLDISL